MPHSRYESATYVRGRYKALTPNSFSLYASGALHSGGFFVSVCQVVMGGFSNAHQGTISCTEPINVRGILFGWINPV